MDGVVCHIPLLVVGVRVEGAVDVAAKEELSTESDEEGRPLVVVGIT